MTLCLVVEMVESVQIHGAALDDVWGLLMLQLISNSIPRSNLCDGTGVTAVVSPPTIVDFGGGRIRWPMVGRVFAMANCSSMKGRWKWNAGESWICTSSYQMQVHTRAHGGPRTNLSVF